MQLALVGIGRPVGRRRCPMFARGSHQLGPHDAADAAIAFGVAHGLRVTTDLVDLATQCGAPQANRALACAVDSAHSIVTLITL